MQYTIMTVARSGHEPKMLESLEHWNLASGSIVKIRQKAGVHPHHLQRFLPCPAYHMSISISERLGSMQLQGPDHMPGLSLLESIYQA